MAVFALVAAVLLATLNGGAADLVGHFETSWLECNAQGFAPTFEYSTQGETQEFKFDVILGDGAGNCTYNGMDWIQDDTVSVNASVANNNFTGNYATFFPYKEAGVEFCGGSFEHIDDNGTDKIEYNVTGKIVLYRKFRSTVVRKVQYDFEILCHMERDVLSSDDDGYKVSADLVSTGDKDEKKADFTFGATLELTDSAFNTTYSTEQEYKNNEDLYLKVTQDANQEYFQFSVEECYATSGSDSSLTGVDQDLFIDDKCPVDETTVTNYASTTEYRIQTMAFTFFQPSDSSAAIHFHCKLKVCLATDNGRCFQAGMGNGCSSYGIDNMRKRRAIEYDEDVKIVSASTPVFLRGSEFQAPACKEGSVFDRVIGTCSRKNILEIRGIRLSNDIYNPDYANTSSVAFKEMAYTKEYQLWVLVKASNNHRVIEGIKIIRARPGSVVLDVLVKHTENVLPEEAFEVFEKAMSTPASTTRVQKILQIKQGTTQVEFVPIVLGGDNSKAMDSEKLILIVVLVVLFCVVFVAAGALFKVRNNRQSNTTPRGSGFDNKGIDA